MWRPPPERACVLSTYVCTSIPYSRLPAGLSGSNELQTSPRCFLGGSSITAPHTRRACGGQKTLRDLLGSKRHPARARLRQAATHSRLVALRTGVLTGLARGRS